MAALILAARLACVKMAIVAGELKGGRFRMAEMGLMEVGRLKTGIIPFCRSHGGMCVQYAMGTISLASRIWYNSYIQSTRRTCSRHAPYHTCSGKGLKQGQERPRLMWR